MSQLTVKMVNPSADLDDSASPILNSEEACTSIVTAESVSFTAGTRWFVDGVEVELLSMPTLHDVLVKKLATNETVQVARAALKLPPQVTVPGQIQNVEKVSDEELAWALDAQATLDPYLDGKVLDHETAKTFASKFGVDARTVRRWLQTYKSHRHLASFLKRKPGPAAGTAQIEPQVDAIIAASIKEQMRLAGSCTVTSIFDEIKNHCEVIGLPVPAESTIQRRVNKALKVPDNYPPELRNEVKHKLDLVKGSLTPAEPLEYVQVDHTVMDVSIRDPFSRQIIGRPLITVAFEVATRVVLGFVLSLEAPSQLATALCLHRAVFPKEEWLKRIGATGPWPFFGLMKYLHTDLAAEFVSPWVKRAGKRFNIDILHRRGGQPQDGGHIERYLGTLSVRCHMLPGTTYVHSLKKKTSKSKAIFTMSALETWVANEMSAYMHEPHSGLDQKSPAQAWEESFKTKNGIVLPGYPKNEQEFLISFLPGDARVVTREGIDWKGLRYRSEELRPFIQPGVRHRFRFDKRDISAIYLEPPTGDHIRIPWINNNWDPISLWEWDEIRIRNGKRARVSDQETIRRAREANRELIRQQAKKSQRGRRREAREREWEVVQQSNGPLATDRKLKPTTVSINSTKRSRFEVLE